MSRKNTKNIITKGEEENQVSKPGPRSSKITIKEIRPVSVVIQREDTLPMREPARASRQEKPDVEEEDTPIDVTTIDDDGDVYLPDKGEEPLPKKRKQGRPVTTGEYEILKAKRAEQSALRELREEKSMLDPATPLSNSQAWQRLERKAADFSDEVLQAPTVDVVARGLENITVLKKCAIMSKNLKGTVRKEISEAACYLQAAVAALAASAMTTTGVENREGESELDILQRQNRVLRSEILMLKSETKRLKEEGMTRKERRSHVAPRRNTSVEENLSPDRGRASTSVAMEVEAAGGMELSSSPRPPEMPPINRPPVMGAVKRLEEYPSGVMDEDKGRYDELTSDIQRLLDQREALKKGAKKGPQLKPLSDKVPSSTANLQYAVTPKCPVPAKGGGGKGKKKKGGKQIEDNSLKGNAGKAVPRTVALAQKGDLPQNNSHPLPQPSVEPQEVSWAKVVGRREARTKRTTPSKPFVPPSANSSRAPKAFPPLKNERAEGKAGPRAAARGKGRIPRTAAIMVTCPEGQYSETITMARQKIDLEELEIKGMKARRAASGAILYEIPGENKAAKADLFAQKLREAVEGKEGVRVARPCKKGDIRVRGLDESATVEEVKEVVAKLGGCQVSEIKAGQIRFGRGSMGTLWLQCPIAAIVKVATAGKIRVGWVVAKVEVLETRPLQCYRCMERGHVKEKCSNPVDRSGWCYNCGSPGHRANACNEKTRCVLCAEVGAPANHRVGSENCHAKKKRKAVKSGSQKTRSMGEKQGGMQIETCTQSAQKEAPKPQRILRPRGTSERKVQAVAKIPPPDKRDEEPMEMVTEEA